MALPSRCPHCDRVCKGRCSCVQRDYDKTRGTSSERGYDSRWRAVRSEKLKLNPLCQDCELGGKITVANEVHHIVKVSVSPESRLDLNNLMSLCKACHSIRTLRGE